MSGVLQRWEREYYETGGGDPFLFYVLYGTIDHQVPLSRSQYRSQGMPEGLQIMTYGPSKHPQVPSSFREGYLWEKLQKLDPSFAESIAMQDSCMIFKGSFEDPETLNYFRDTIGLITHFLDQGGVAIYDPQMLEWWSPEQWKTRIFEPAAMVPRHHTIILVSEDDHNENAEWVHTRGMRKFGRPDISFRGVTSGLKDGAIDLCNRFIEYQAFGGVITEGEEIRMKSLPEGLRCFHRGDVDDPDFNNVHIAIE